MRRALLAVTVVGLVAGLAVGLAGPAQAKMPPFELRPSEEPAVVGRAHQLVFGTQGGMGLPGGLEMDGLVGIVGPDGTALRPVVRADRDGATLLAEVVFPVAGTWVLNPFPHVTAPEEREQIARNYPVDVEIVVMESPERWATARERVRCRGPGMLLWLGALPLAAGGLVVRRIRART